MSNAFDMRILASADCSYCANLKEMGENMGIKPAIIVFLAALSLTVFGNANADIYSWVDEKGVKHFSNTPVDLDDKADISVQTGKNMCLVTLNR